MTQPLLSILIPTVVGREEQFERLFGAIVRQYKTPIKKVKVTDNGYEQTIMGFCHSEDDNSHELILIAGKDDKSMTIGEKREKLYNASWAIYSWQIDDDDDIDENAIELIFDAIKKGPDCITFRERCMINDKYYSSNHSLKYTKWQDNFDGFDYVRSPFYKDVIRTDIAKSVPFEYIRWNEDERWSYALLPHLKTEIHIDEELYHYIHNSTPSHERYGFDKD